jgi:hypothetical protein
MIRIVQRILPGRSRALLVRVRGDQRPVHVDHEPSGQGLPCDDQPREPLRGRLDEFPHVRAGFRAGFRDPLQHRGAAGQVQGTPDRRAARRVPQYGSEVRQHRDVAHARGPQRDRHCHRYQRGTAIENG